MNSKADATPSIVQTLMSFSALAYVMTIQDHDYKKGYDEIVGQIPGLAQESGWELAWGPGIGFDDLLPVNSAFIAQNQTLNAYAVVLEGTMDFGSWILENASVEQTPCDYYIPDSLGPDAATPLVSKGFEKARSILCGQMTDVDTTILEFLQSSISGSPTVYVTGHSQGGATCQLVGAWLKYCQYQDQLNQDADIEVFGFAGPTAGDPGMAQYINYLFGTSFRYQNPFDCAGLAFNDLPGMKTIYEPSICPKDLEKLAIDALQTLLDVDGIIYKQPVTDIDFPNSGIELEVSWADEVGYQHNHLNYCGWLGANKPTGTTKS